MIIKDEKSKKRKYKSDLIKYFIKKIKSIFQKQVLVDLYIMYFKDKYYNHYFLSLKFFIAIIKKYPFKKICLNYMSRKKEENKNKKVIYLVEILSLILKMKVFEKIYKYCQGLQIKIIKENIQKIFKSVKKIILKYSFEKIKNNNEMKRNETNEEIKEVINHEINEEINEELNENENIITNNLDNIYSDKLKEVIDKINNADEKNIKFKNSDNEYSFENIKKEMQKEQIRNDTNINYINIIINNNINNALNKKENDISDDEDINKGKFWDIEPEEKKKKNYLIIKNPSKNKNNIKEFDELYSDIKQMKSYSECSGLVNESKSNKENSNKDEKNLDKNKLNKVNKNVNICLKKEIKVFNNKKGKDKKEINLCNNEGNLNKLKDLIKENNINNYIDEITEQIVKYVLENEISKICT